MSEYVRYQIASEVLETRRIPDPYYYSFDHGKLVMVFDGVKMLVEDAVERSSYLGIMEFAGLQSLQTWATMENSGTSVWVSGICRPVYDEVKIIVSEIVRVDGVKKVENRAIVLDGFTNAGALAFANSLGITCYRGIEELRAVPAVVASDVDWLEELGKYLDVIQLREVIATGEDWQEKTRIINAVKSGIAIPIGNKPLRCAPRMPTAFEAMFGNYFECPNCKGLIRSGLGITKCPHCGITKEKYAEGSAEQCD